MPRQHGNCLLTAYDVASIRRYRRVVRAERLATIYGVSRATVYAVWCGARRG